MQGVRKRERRECCNSNSLSLTLSPALARTTFLPGPFVLNFRGWQRKNLPVVLIQQMWFLFLPCTHTHAYTGFSFAHTIATFTVSASFSFFLPGLFAALFALVSLFIIYAYSQSFGFYFVVILSVHKQNARTDTNNKQTTTRCVCVRGSETTTIDNRRQRVKRQNINNYNNDAAEVFN